MISFQNNEKVFKGVQGHDSPGIFWILTLQSPLFRVSDSQASNHVIM